jgi:hypothetical protein
LVSCGGNSVSKVITCDEIIQAYEKSGYYISCHEHSEALDAPHCYIIIYETEEMSSDLVEINLYNTEEEAKEATKEKKYNIAMWFIAVIYGEGRWLTSGSYGSVEYSSYNAKMLQPLKDLME